MGMAAILFNGSEPFEQIVNILSTEGRMSNLVKIGPAVSEKKTSKDYMILYLYIAQGQMQTTPEGKILILTKKIYYFNHIW